MSIHKLLNVYLFLLIRVTFAKVFQFKIQHFETIHLDLIKIQYTTSLNSLKC